MNLPDMIFGHEPHSIGLAALTRLAETAFTKTAGALQVRLAERVKQNLQQLSQRFSRRTSSPNGSPKAIEATKESTPILLTDDDRRLLVHGDAADVGDGPYPSRLRSSGTTQNGACPDSMR
jgi:hypothetical protein